MFAVEVPVGLDVVLKAEAAFRALPYRPSEEAAILAMFSQMDKRIEALIRTFKPNARPNSFQGIKNGLLPNGYMPMLVFDEINDLALAEIWIGQMQREWVEAQKSPPR